MMTEHPHALLLRQAWQAAAHSDVETLKELWADDIVWHVTADNPWQGDHIGHEAVLEYLAQVGEAGEIYDTELKDVLMGNDYAALVCRVTTKRADRLLEFDQVLLGRFRGHRIVEVWALPSDPSAVSRFWA